jgi:hypothetical protein
MDAAVEAARVKAQAGDAAGAAGLLEPVLLAEPSLSEGLGVRPSIPTSVGRVRVRRVGHTRSRSARIARSSLPPEPPAATTSRSAEEHGARKLHASSGDAEAELEAAHARAREIYLRAYFARDEDVESARADFRMVMATLPSDDETAQKAKRWLDKLEGKSGKEE